MANGVNATDLNGALDVLKAAGKRDPNNLALADQLQFSSILRTLVDTPEQTLEVVEAATHAREEDKLRPQAPERDGRANRQVDRDRDGVRRGDRPHEAREPRPERLDPPGLKPITVSAPVDETAPEPDFADGLLVAAERPAQAPVPVRPVDLNSLRAPQAIEALAASHASERARADSPESALAQSQAVLVHAAQSMTASALADRHFSRVGEDLHDAALHQFVHVGQRAGAPTAASSLKQEQETDLASRLGLNTPLAIQVDAGTEQAKVRATPLHSLSGAAVMAEFDGLDAGANPVAQAFGKSGGESASTEQKAPTHGTLLTDRQIVLANGQDAGSFGQVLRAQGALIAAQQSAHGAPEAKPVLSSEVTQITGAAGPSGPSQVSQTQKANPTTAARQPERPQAPAEQIAVKIRQAVDDGADKINIKLNPAHLGRVEVRLEIKDGHIAATVLAERQETLDMLQKDARGLERALLDAGLRTDLQSLNFGLRGDGQKNLDAGRDRRPNGFGRSSERMDAGLDRADEAMAGKAAYGRSLRANGGVDIRV